MKVKIVIKNILKISIFLISILGTISIAHQRVVVVPLLSDAEPIKTTVTVGAEDADFSNIADALDSIEDASYYRRYRILVYPGIYHVSEPIFMKRYVDIIGSGAEVTKITGALAYVSFASGAIIHGASDATLGFLTIENMGGNTALQSVSVGIFNLRSSLNIEHVKVIARGASIVNVAFFSLDSLSTVSYSSFTARGSQNAYGLVSNSSSDTLVDIEAYALDASNENVGISIVESDSTFVRTSSTAQSGAKAFGVYILRSTPILTSLNSESTLSGSSYGIFNDLNSNALFRNSRINGDTTSISNLSGGLVTLIRSSINNTPLNNGGMYCIESFDQNSNDLDFNCLSSTSTAMKPLQHSKTSDLFISSVLESCKNRVGFCK